MSPERLIEGGRLRLDRLQALTGRPSLFAPGEPHFWDDPHIARQMLAAHLNPETDAASHRPEVIEGTVDWLMALLDLRPGVALLDLGCGPGLYTRRLAARGLHVTGVDFSQHSIAFARQHDPASEYRCQNYLTLDAQEAYDVVTLIYGDFCVLPDVDRDRLLGIIHSALRPGGHFVFDVMSLRFFERHRLAEGWSVDPAGGFWKPGPYLLLTQGFAYPEQTPCSTSTRSSRRTAQPASTASGRTVIRRRRSQRCWSGAASACRGCTATCWARRTIRTPSGSASSPGRREARGGRWPANGRERVDDGCFHRSQ